MASVNLCIFVGHLGKDPETRYTAGGDAVANFSIACTESWKDKQSGEKKELTEWVRCSTFGKLAEICGQYLKKGSQVYIEGKMQTRKWTDKDGQERYTTEIKVHEMKMLGGRSDSGSTYGGDDSAPASEPKGDNKRREPAKQAPDFNEDEIPF